MKTRRKICGNCSYFSRMGYFKDGRCFALQKMTKGKSVGCMIHKPQEVDILC